MADIGLKPWKKCVRYNLFILLQNYRSLNIGFWLQFGSTRDYTHSSFNVTIAFLDGIHKLLHECIIPYRYLVEIHVVQMISDICNISKTVNPYQMTPRSVIQHVLFLLEVSTIQIHQQGAVSATLCNMLEYILSGGLNNAKHPRVLPSNQ